MLKVARTITDIAGVQTITAAHLAEAVQYRRVDKSESELRGRGTERLRKDRSNAFVDEAPV